MLIVSTGHSLMDRYWIDTTTDSVVHRLSVARLWWSSPHGSAWAPRRCASRCKPPCSPRHRWHHPGEVPGVEYVDILWMRMMLTYVNILWIIASECYKKPIKHQNNGSTPMNSGKFTTYQLVQEFASLHNMLTVKTQ